MPSFPRLQTGAITQYPSDRGLLFCNEVSRFVDGTEQRFPQVTDVSLRWAIRLNLLTDAEQRAIVQFHNDQGGRDGVFSFVDPWTGTQYDNCSFENDAFQLECTEEAQFQTECIIRRNRT